jgi:hypothetical protein
MRSSRCTTGVINTGGKLKKSSIRKVLLIFLEHLCLVELTYRYIFSFKFTLRCQQSDILATGVVDTGGKFAGGVVYTGGN